MSWLVSMWILGVCHSLAGDRISGRDLAAADPAFAAIAPEAVIGFAPSAGVPRVLRADELARLARMHGIATTAPLHEVCFERATTLLREDAVAEALRNALPGAHIEILDFSRYPVPEGRLEFSVSGLGAPSPPSSDSPAIWRGRVRAGSGRSAPVWARVKVGVERTWVEAASDLPAGKLIEAAQLRIRIGPRFPLLPPAATTIEAVAGKRLLRAIATGQPIHPSALATPREIERGENVRVEVSSGATRLGFEARAESAGRAGEVILMRNPENGRLFRGRVEGRGKVVVIAEVNGK